MRLEVICIGIVAIVWGGWPLVSRSAGHGGPWAALVLSLAALVPIVVMNLFDPDAARPSLPEYVKLAIAGTMMGIGTVAFNYVANSEIDASVSIPIIDASMLLVTAIGAVWFFQEAVTVQKVAGVVLLVGGISLLRPA